MKLSQSRKAEGISFGMTEIVRWTLIIIVVLVIIMMIVYFTPKLVNSISSIF